MKTVLIIFIFIIAASNVPAQDTIIQKSGRKILCKIQKEDSSKVSVILTINGRQISTFLDKNEIECIHYYQPSSMILLTNNMTGKTVLIHNNTKIKLATSSNKIIKGRLSEIKDSVIVLNNDSILKIADIQIIYLKPSLIFQIIGYPLLAAGAVGVVYGLIFVVAGVGIAFGPTEFFPPFFGVIFIGAGGVLSSVGLFSGDLGLRALKKQKYLVQEWNIKVIYK